MMRRLAIPVAVCVTLSLTAVSMSAAAGRPISERASQSCAWPALEWLLRAPAEFAIETLLSWFAAAPSPWGWGGLTSMDADDVPPNGQGTGQGDLPWPNWWWYQDARDFWSKPQPYPRP